MTIKNSLGVACVTILALNTSAFAAMTQDGSGMTNGSSSMSSLSGLNSDMYDMNSMLDSDNGSDEDGISNQDEYVIDTPTTHSGNLVINNTDVVTISDTLYVYGDMTVSNADSFVVTGKLRVTGKLTVNNVDIEVKGGRLYYGSKKMINGSIKSKAMRVMAELTKIDPLLSAELTEEEWKDVVATATEAKKELASLKKELMSARKLGTDTAPIVAKILANRAAFFGDISAYVGDDDQDLLKKLEKADLTMTKRANRIK
ncbi:hypothetical protein HOO68_00910 [Candidatus Gracilibacteria bacterium]|nr:hypothetical protein [Candidatus Gracilibacteria bacterium]